MCGVLQYKTIFRNLDVSESTLTIVLPNPDMPCLPNNVDPDQLASEEANCSGSAMFVMKSLYP